MCDRGQEVNAGGHLVDVGGGGEVTRVEGGMDLGIGATDVYGAAGDGVLYSAGYGDAVGDVGGGWWKEEFVLVFLGRDAGCCSRVNEDELERGGLRVFELGEYRAALFLGEFSLVLDGVDAGYHGVYFVFGAGSVDGEEALDGTCTA